MKKIEINSERWLSLENINGERWEIICEYPNYSISNYGRLKMHKHSINIIRRDGKALHRTFNERIVKITKNRSGYYRYTLCNTNGSKQFSIHRLVAQFFVPNPNNLPCVNHKDEDKTNNWSINLEWCTNKYNNNYGTSKIRRSQSVIAAKRNNNKIIKQYSLDGILLNTFIGRHDVINAGYDYNNVTACCRHLYPKSQGFVWRYDKDPFTKDGKDWNISKKARKVGRFDLNGNLLSTYESMYKAGFAMKGDRTGAMNIKLCCDGKNKTAYGYIWKRL